jgi:competence protein ComGC
VKNAQMAMITQIRIVSIMVFSVVFFLLVVPNLQGKKKSEQLGRETSVNCG